MSCFKLPKWLIQEIDKRQSFLLEVSKKRLRCKLHGGLGECYIISTPKQGGLGVKNLEQQNISLLRFIHKYHT
jgi:hypothetical protein